MRKDFVDFPKSSFLGMPKDTALIMDKILKNQRLLKLLYYSDRDWESKPDLGSEELKSLITNKQISNVPKLVVDKVKRSYLRIGFDDFITNQGNPYYRDCVLEIKIACHFDDWDLDNYELRPFRIAGELDSMLNGERLTGIGILNFLSAGQDIYDDEYGGVTLRYFIVHGDEDKKNPLE